MRLGQIEQLLDTVTQPQAEPVAATEGDQRLGQLVTGVVLVRPGVGETGDTLQAIGFRHRQHDRARPDDDQDQQEPPQRRPRKQQHPHDAAGQHHDGTVVGLENQQKANQRHYRQRAHERPPASAHLGQVALEIAGDIDDQAQLGDFRRLDIDDAERNPAPTTVDLATDDQDHEQQQQRHDQHQRPFLAPPVQWQTHGKQPHPDRREHENAVPDAEVVRVAGQARGDFGGSGSHHHPADQHQRKRRQQQPAIERLMPRGQSLLRGLQHRLQHAASCPGSSGP